MLNGSYAAWTREEVSRKRRPNRRIQNRLDTQLDMKKVAFYSKPLDDSNGTVKNVQNNAMQPASQTTESPETVKNGLLAVLAVGVDAAASFLKSKMEKAAAVASQVGAAVLNSKKAVSAAASAVFVGLLPKQPKKARLAVSAPILALLACIFSAQPQAMSQYLDYGPHLPVGAPLPFYEIKNQSRATTLTPNIPLLGQFAYGSEDWHTDYRFNSEFFPPSFMSLFGIYAASFECRFDPDETSIFDAGYTSALYYRSGDVVATFYFRDKFGQVTASGSFPPSHGLVEHSQVGKKITEHTPATLANFMLERRTVEEWKCPFYSSSTGTPRPGDIIAHIATWFVARYEGKTLEDGWDGSCDSITVKSPGPEVIHTPCLPSNMNAATNSCIIYHLETSFTARTSAAR